MSEETENAEAGATDDWADAMAEQAIAEAEETDAGNPAAEFENL